MVSGESISGQPIDQFKIFVLSYAPVEGFNESICNLDLQFSRPRIFDHFQHAAGQIIVIATTEKLNDRIIKIILIDHSIRYNHWHAHGHELKDFRAERLVSKVIFSLRYDSEISRFHNAGNFLQRTTGVHADLTLDPQLFNELHQLSRCGPVAIDMKFRVRSLLTYFGKSTNRNVETLVPV